jgi:hypothetical protein
MGSVINEYGAGGEMKTGKGNRIIRTKLTAIPFYPPQIPRGPGLKPESYRLNNMA